MEAALRSASSAVPQGLSMARRQSSSTAHIKVTGVRDRSHIELDDTESMLSTVNDAVSTILRLSQSSNFTQSTISSSSASFSSGTSTSRAKRTQTPTPATSTAQTPIPQTEELFANLLAFREELQSLLTTGGTSSSRRPSNLTSTYRRFLEIINSVECLVGRTSNTPINLCSAIVLHDTETATRLILASDVQAINAPNTQGRTPLFLAAMKGSLTLVRLLLERGASPTLRGETGLSVVQAICAAEDPESRKEILEALLKAEAPTAAGPGADTPPLHTAAVRGRLDYVDLLIAFGADINAVENGQRGSTALRAVCDKIGNTTHAKVEAVTERLLRAGADVNAERRNGSTVLEGVLRSLDVAVREMILSSHPDGFLVLFFSLVARYRWAFAVLRRLAETVDRFFFLPVARYRWAFAVLRTLVEEVDSVRLRREWLRRILNRRLYEKMMQMLDGDMIEVRKKVNREFVAMQMMTSGQLYRAIVRQFSTSRAQDNI